MLVQEEVKNILDSVMVPGVKRSVQNMNLIKDINVDDGKVNITHKA